MTTKQYLRFEPGNVFGLVASTTSKIVQIDSKNKNFDLFASPACENVYIWNMQSKEKVQVLSGEYSSVSCFVTDSACRNIAVGYEDGMIRVFDLRTGKCEVSFIGHKSAVSCLTFEDKGSNLASGGKDTEIVLWNVTDESGLFRLKGHKGPITKCIFFQPQNVLISSSKDTHIKFWDLDTCHCFYTIVGNRSEVLDCVIVKETKLIAGLNEGFLKCWDIILEETEEEKIAKKLRINFPDISSITDQNILEKEEMSEKEHEKFKVIEAGELKIDGNRCSSITVDATERILGIHGSAQIIQLFKILTSAEMEKKLEKKKAQALKRKIEIDDLDSLVSISDEFRSLGVFTMMSKVDSFALSIDKQANVKITVLFKNNSIAQYHLNLEQKKHLESGRSIMIPGHHSVIRTLSYSSDSLSLLSASDESIKIWKSFKEEQTCTNTLECRAALCSLFVTGNNHCIIGTRKGELKIYDIYANELLENIEEAHLGAVQSITSSPGQTGITSGSSDKNIKFWDYELISDSNYSDIKKRLSLIHRRTLKMSDEVICLKYSPDGKKLAIALLDSTVQVLFADTLKLAFSLYGHSQPVSCLDISHDSTLIVTGSEDKDVRIWSMEFGSCNKFLKKAHYKGITCICFLPNTHLFFTASRDNTVIQWDADNFQKIITLKGHQYEITTMTVSPDGSSVVTASRDKSIRMWNKTREPLVLQEQQEDEEEEKLEEKEDLPVIPGETNKEVALSGKKTMETIKTVDQLIEALKIYSSEVSKLEEYKLECSKTGETLPKPALHPLLMAYRVSTPLEYMRKVILKIKSSELEGALLHLPFSFVLDFLKILSDIVDKGWETELCERCVSFLIRIHFGQILSTESFQPVIEKLKSKLFTQVYHMRDMIGYAKTVSNLQQLTIDAREEISMFSGILENVQNKAKKKSKRKLERPIITFH